MNKKNILAEILGEYIDLEKEVYDIFKEKLKEGFKVKITDIKVNDDEKNVQIGLRSFSQLTFLDLLDIAKISFPSSFSKRFEVRKPTLFLENEIYHIQIYSKNIQNKTSLTSRLRELGTKYDENGNKKNENFISSLNENLKEEIKKEKEINLTIKIVSPFCNKRIDWEKNILLTDTKEYVIRKCDHENLINAIKRDIEENKKNNKTSPLLDRLELWNLSPAILKLPDCDNFFYTNDLGYKDLLKLDFAWNNMRNIKVDVNFLKNINEKHIRDHKFRLLKIKKCCEEDIPWNY